MMRTVFSVTGLLLAIGLAQTAQGQPVTVVRPIPGFACMRLNLPREQIISRDLDVPVYAGPSVQSPRAGSAFATMIVHSPMNIQNGFAQLMLLNGREVWIQQDLLKPFATPEAPNSRCTPSVLSNGRIGFNFH